MYDLMSSVWQATEEADLHVSNLAYPSTKILSLCAQIKVRCVALLYVL
jgi:hypothetical protein